MNRIVLDLYQGTIITGHQKQVTVLVDWLVKTLAWKKKLQKTYLGA